MKTAVIDVEQALRDPRDAVEALLGRRVQDLQGTKIDDPLDLVDGYGCGAHGLAAAPWRST